MQANTNTGPLSRAQLDALLSILKPYKHEPLTPAIMAIATRLAILEAAQ